MMIEPLSGQDAPEQTLKLSSAPLKDIFYAEIFSVITFRTTGTGIHMCRLRAFANYLMALTQTVRACSRQDMEFEAFEGST
jgi:hypothetical protein